MHDTSHQSLLAALRHPVLRDALDALLLVLDREGCILSFNRACEQATGYSETEVMGHHFRFLIPEEQRAGAEQAFADLLRGKTANRHVNAWLTRDDNERIIQWSNTVLSDAAGEPAYVIATGIDITTYRDTLHNHLESDDRYRALVETSADVIWEVDIEARYRYISPRVTDVLGYDPKEMLGRTAFEFMEPDEAKRLRRIFLRHRKERTAFTHLISRRRHADGHEVILSCSGTPFFDANGKLEGFRGIARDITELYRIEERLRASEQRLRLSQQFAQIGTWEWHIPTGEVFWSEAIWHIFGQDPLQFTPTYKNFLATIHNDDRNTVVNAIEQCLRGDARYDIEFRIVWSDGSIHWVRAIGDVEHDDTNQPDRMLGIVQPIDERKQAESRLHASERRYRFLIENAPDAISLIDESATVVEVNQLACELFGYAREEMVGRIAFGFVPPEYREQNLELFHRVMQGESPIAEETWIRTKQGRDVPVELRAAALHTENGSLIQVILRDISERRQREAARLAREQRQRNALVREVHHRIKNNLQGILGLLRSHALDRADPAQAIDEAIRQIQSIALIHGIHGQREDGLLLLCDMLPAIADALAPWEARHRGHVVVLELSHPLAVMESESVALALIVNELLTNASKHADDPERPLRIGLRTGDGRGEVRIHSPGARLPADFDFARCRGCGTGLELVRALMPRQGLALEHQQLGDGVLTRLQLDAPIVRAVATDKCHCAPGDAADRPERTTGDAT